MTHVCDSPVQTEIFFRVIWFIQRTKWTNWLGKRFIRFDERVWTGESRTCITV